ERPRQQLPDRPFQLLSMIIAGQLERQLDQRLGFFHYPLVPIEVLGVVGVFCLQLRVVRAQGDLLHRGRPEYTDQVVAKGHESPHEGGGVRCAALSMRFSSSSLEMRASSSS